MLFYIVETVPLKELHDFRKSITVHYFRTTNYFSCRAHPTIFPCAIFLVPNIATWIVLGWGGFKWCNIHAKLREYPSCFSKFARMKLRVHKSELFYVLRKKQILKLVCNLQFFIALLALCETSEMLLTLQKKHKYLSINVSSWGWYKFFLIFI